MKFAHRWPSEIAGLPPDLRAACIDYRGWKKRIKRGDIEVVAALERECGRVDAAFIAALAALRPRCLGCFHSLPAQGGRGARTTDLLRFARANSLCVYKVCKRADKRTKGTGPGCRGWLVGVRKERRFRFMGGPELATLELELDEESAKDEGWVCPICTEGGKGALVLRCGHALCVDCALRHAGVRHLRGQLHNVFANAKRDGSCPFCRFPRAFEGVTERSVFFSKP